MVTTAGQLLGRQVGKHCNDRGSGGGWGTFSAAPRHADPGQEAAAWSDSDTEDDGDRLLATPTSSRGLAVGVGGTYYDRACTSVDNVLVPAGADNDDGRDGGKPSSASVTRRALAAAGLVAGGCLCAYLAWRYCGGAGKLIASS